MAEFASPPAARGVLLPGLDLVSDGVLLLDGRWNIAVANAWAPALVRVAADSLEGMEFWDLLAQATIDLHQVRAEAALKSLGHYRFVEENVFAAESTEYCLTRRPAGVVVGVRRVSEQTDLAQRMLEMGRRLNGVFAANPNAMWVLDPASLRVLDVNEAALALYGHSRAAFLRLGAAGIYLAQGESELRAMLPQEAAGRRWTAAALRQHRREDGGLMLVEVAGCFLKWDDAPAVLLTVADVTHSQAALADLRRHNEELQEALQAQASRMELAGRESAAYAYALSHDLQGPLHVVAGFANTLATRYAPVLGDQGLHFLHRIQASVAHLSRLIGNLRQLMRIPGLALNPQPVDLAPACRALLGRLAELSPERRVDVEIDAQLLLTGDRGLLLVALDCLLDNAWKFTSRTHPAWIRVSAADGPRPGDRTLVVSDNGSGFDSAYAHKLFVPFQRLHSSMDFPGTGLGLAIVSKIAQRHGGCVRAESGDGPGARFSLALPGPGPAQLAAGEKR